MKELSQCIEEIKLRGNRKLKAHKRKLVCVCACFMMLCVCTTVAVAYPWDKDAAYNPPITGDSVLEDSLVSIDSAEPQKPNRVVITGDDSCGPKDFNDGKELYFVPSKSKRYVSPALEEEMKKHGADVFYRVIVEIFLTDEDYDEKNKLPDPPLSEEALAISAQIKELNKELDALLEEFNATDDKDKRDRLMEEEKEKERISQSLRNKYSDLIWKEKSKVAAEFYKGVYASRLEYAYSVGAENVVPLATSSDFYPCLGDMENSYFMELTAEMINKMAEQGGYAFRLAPSARVQGYDVKVSDYLTLLLDNADEETQFHVAVVLAADWYNEFANNRNIFVNFDYNREYAKLIKTALPNLNTEFGYLSLEERSAIAKEYQDSVVKRNGLTEKCVISEYDPRKDAWIYAFGFEAKLTKAEILSLIKDEEVKVVYSMTHKSSTHINRVSVNENE